MFQLGVCVALLALPLTHGHATDRLPPKLLCKAEQTAGLHDYAGPPQDYEPSTFFESKFQLRINRVLTQHLAPETTASIPSTDSSPDLFLTLFPRNDTPVELRCRQVQGGNQELGYSCTNTPPSELLLINPTTLRFTRASIGGWTFTDSNPDKPAAEAAVNADETAAETSSSDESLFVEYGRCSKS